MAEYKKQHYVPQFYLRQFSHDGKMVYAYNLKHKKVYPMKIKNMCQENYFYCNTPELEQSLGKIEEKQAEVITEVINKSNFSLIEIEDRIYLLLFILMQCTRTKDSKDFADNFVDTIFDTHFKPLMKESNDLINKGMKPEFIDSLKLNVDRTHLMMMLPAMLGVDSIRDLGMVLILNHTDRNFATSDAPFCLYNYIKPKNHGMLGFQSPGLLIFCPLNDKMLLLLFDPELYNVTLNDKLIIHVEKTSDIDAINKLQIHNCLENLICSEEEDGDYLNQLHVEIENNLKKSRIESILSYKKHAIDGGNDEITNMHRTPMNYTLKLSFLKLNHINNRRIRGEIRRSKKSGEPIKLCRNPKICETVDKYIENANQMIRKKRHSNK